MTPQPRVRRLRDVPGAGYLVPPTKNPGDLLTSPLWNSFIRDNLDFGMVRPVGDVVLGSSAASVDFTSIPATFAHLLLVLYLRSDAGATSAALNLRLNNDSGANYDLDAISATSGAPSGADSYAGGAISLPGISAGTAPADTFAPYLLFLPGYAGGGNKTVVSVGGYKTGAVVGSLLTDIRTAYWRSNVAINRLTLTTGGNFVARSRVTVYGMGGI